MGNSSVLKDTALIEAFNLKGAIEYAMKNTEAAREALSDMPPRAEEELDPVTLHNQALMRMDEDPTGGFSVQLAEEPPAPAETFGNLLLRTASHSTRSTTSRRTSWPRTPTWSRGT